MQLFVPSCGDRIKLTADWKFRLFLEYGNRNFGVQRNTNLTLQDFDHYDFKGDNVDCVLPAGTLLECDRVYIRTNSKQIALPDATYDSITWRVVTDGKAKMKDRFWVKLADANKIEFEVDSLYRDRKT